MAKLRSVQPKRRRAAVIMTCLERHSLEDCLYRLMNEEDETAQCLSLRATKSELPGKN